jgi:hypothetical protein
LQFASSARENQDSQMTMFQTIAALVSLAAIASYVNHRFVRLPTTIGLMTIALVLSLRPGRAGQV